MIVSVLNSVLSQLGGVIGQMSDEEYAQPLDLLDGSSIGKHARHVMEFVGCLTNLSEGEACEVCYDNRQRSLELESSTKSAVDYMEQLSEKLVNIQYDRQILTRGSYNGGKEYFIKSSMERELVYNIEHAIHHLAIIKIALKSQYPHIDLPEGFGKAHSTIRYELAQSS